MISAAVAMLTRTPLRRAHLYKGLSERTFIYHFITTHTFIHSLKSPLASRSK